MGEDENGSGETSVEDLAEELGGDGGEDISGGGSGGSGSEEDDPIEFVEVDEDFFYMAHVMRLAAMLHSMASLAMLIAYYHLKVNIFYLIYFGLFIQANVYY